MGNQRGPKDKPELKAAGYTKTDFKKFDALTHFIIDKLALEPTWRIKVFLLEKEDMPEEDIDACTSWAPHYRDATIKAEITFIRHRRDWAYTLMHELIHVRMAPIHDHVKDVTPKASENDSWNTLETTTSEVANTMSRFLFEAYGDIMEKWIK